MMLFTVALFQASMGLSGTTPHEEALRFTFARDARIGDTRIVGTSSTRTEWSSPALVAILQRCGAEAVTASRDNGRIIFSEARSTTSDLQIARCVKAETSLRFDVGVRESGFAAVQLDRTPFRKLWDS